MLIIIVSASLGHMMGEVSSGGGLCEMTGHKFHFYYDLFEQDDFGKMVNHSSQQQIVEPAREPCWPSVSQETLRRGLFHLANVCNGQKMATLPPHPISLLL